MQLYLSVFIRGQLDYKFCILPHLISLTFLSIWCFLFLTAPILSNVLFHRISTPDSIGQEIEKKCQSIFPLQNVFIRKVKVLKRPKFDLLKLMEVHGESTEDTGAALDKVAAANTVKALKGAGGRL